MAYGLAHARKQGAIYWFPVAANDSGNSTHVVSGGRAEGLAPLRLLYPALSLFYQALFGRLLRRLFLPAARRGARNTNGRHFRHLLGLPGLRFPPSLLPDLLH